MVKVQKRVERAFIIQSHRLSLKISLTVITIADIACSERLHQM